MRRILTVVQEEVNAMIMKNLGSSTGQVVHPHIGLKQTQPEKQPEATKCPQCEIEFDRLEMICPHCGYDLRGKWNTKDGHESQRTAAPGMGQFKIVTPDMGKMFTTMLVGIPAFIGLVWLLVWLVRHVFRS